MAWLENGDIVTYTSVVFILFKYLQILLFYEVLKSYMVGLENGDIVTIMSLVLCCIRPVWRDVDK